MFKAMTKKEYIFTDKAPRPVGPYSQAVVIGNLVFISGQIPIDSETGKLIQGSFEEQARRVLDNIKAIIEAAGGTMDDIVKVTVYMRDLSKFQEFNRVYAEYFKGGYPARVVVGVARLPLDAELEVEAIAVLQR